MSETKQKAVLVETIKNAFAKIADLPDWMQVILLQDIHATIENRVHTMELILKGKVTQ